MSSREQFESWYLDNWGHTEDHHETLFERSPDDDSEYYRLGVRMAHQAWQAATSAMEAKCAALAAELKQSQIDAGCYRKGMEASNERLVQVAAENAGLKSSRDVLAENTLEACNAIASAGFRHEAIMRGLYGSTGNGNKYPKPITTLVDEAMRKLDTPATDSFLAEVRAQGVEMLAENHQNVVDALNGDSLFADGERRHAAIAAAAFYFAAQLRNGAAQ